MSIKHLREYRDPELAKGLIKGIWKTCRRPIRLMEVCGTHTMSIFRNDIRSVLPEGISLISGPGCPVCVTDQGEIDAFIDIAGKDNTLIATFGDLMRVPGSRSSLQEQRAEGRDIRVVYSSMDALDMAAEHPEKKVIFLGVGFETTAPTVAASLCLAEERGLDNYYVFSAHKLIPPALAGLMENRKVRTDGFILPGHVSVIIGANGYGPFIEKYPIPCAIAGFEPVDILQAIYSLVRQMEGRTARLENTYKRAVSAEGNIKALSLMHDVFEPVDASWRGIGIIPASGLKIRKRFAAHDAQEAFHIRIQPAREIKGCSCGEILTGVMTPPECPLYKKVCTPENPIGPCMVSSEGSCAAFFRYHRSEKDGWKEA
jgi:hydrogenase expression/formation protein HypD